MRFVDPSGKVASKFLAYESGYIGGGVYNAVNSMSFEYLDEWTGINDKISNCSGQGASAGWCDGKDKAYLLETASAVASAPSMLKSLGSMNMKGISEAMSFAKSAKGSTNFFGALGSNIENISPYNLIRTHAIDPENLSVVKDLIAKTGKIEETIKYVAFQGEKYIVDGNHRVRAAKELGIKLLQSEEVQLPYQGYKTFKDLFF